MKIGIGLPAHIPGISGERILDWARRADAGPFSSLGTIDRLVYRNFESLVTLAAVAGVTQRIRLATTILIAPLRNATVLGKQAASIDAISNGRLTLGLSVGGREDDFVAAGIDFHARGRVFEEQLERMYQIWSGQPVAGLAPIGPPPTRPGGPEVLLGGYAPAAIQRLSKYGDGYISGGGPPDMASLGYDVARQAWKEGGRPGAPRLVAAQYFGLGNNARERGGAYLRDYYKFLGPVVESLVGTMPATPQEIRERITAFEEIGSDELIFWPTIPDLEQIELLAEVIG